MKRVIACISLVAAATTAAYSASAPVNQRTPKAAHPTNQFARVRHCRVAPADEYFGRLKMSILGIRNTIKDQSLKVDYDPGRAPTTLNSIALTEDAIHDWQHKYPCDSWLPGSIYALEHFYTKIRTNDGVHHVHLAYAWLRRDFPRDRVLQVARGEDSRASIGSAASAEAASVASGTTGAASAAGQTSTGGMPMQSQATPVPGLAPQSVINAQNQHPRPHQP